MNTTTTSKHSAIRRCLRFLNKNLKLNATLCKVLVIPFQRFSKSKSTKSTSWLWKTIFGILRNAYDYIKKKIIYYTTLIAYPKSSSTPLATSPYLWGKLRRYRAPFVLCFYILCLSLFCLLFLSALSVLGSWIQNGTSGVYPFSVYLIALSVAGIPVVLLWILAYPIVTGKDELDSQDWWMAWVYVNWKLREIRYREDTEKKS